MFTSRAEYRLLLREDNADLRLTAIGRELGLVDDHRWFVQCQGGTGWSGTSAHAFDLDPPTASVSGGRQRPGQHSLTREQSLEELLRRPESDLRCPDGHRGVGPALTDAAAADQVEIQIKYAGYIERQHDEVEKQLRNENTLLPLDMNYRDVNGLSNEVIAKLNDAKPETIGQASRISGITPPPSPSAGAPEETRPAA